MFLKGVIKIKVLLKGGMTFAIKDKERRRYILIRKAILFFLILFLIPMIGYTGVRYTKHDLTTTGGGPWGPFYDPEGNPIIETCVFCHTPHQGSATIYPLWNKNLPTATYSMYASSTMDATMPAQPNDRSKICMSCHDGISAINVVFNAPGPGTYTPDPQGNYTKLSEVYWPGNPFAWYPGPNIGEMGPWNTTTVILNNDHPISMQYRSDLDSELRAPTITGGRTWVINGSIQLPLYGPGTGTGATVECSSCHDVHDTATYSGKGVTEVYFLRTSNVGSQMCMTCHLK